MTTTESVRINAAGTELSLVTLVPYSNSALKCTKIDPELRKKGEYQVVFSDIFMRFLSAHSKVTEMELSECIMSKCHDSQSGHFS